MGSSYLNAIRPPLDVPDAAIFQYPSLEATVNENFKEQYLSADELFEQLDSDDEEVVDLRNSDQFLLVSALKLQNATTDSERYAWSLRYTLASIQSFGRPDPKRVAYLADLELASLRTVKRSSLLQDDQVSKLIEKYQKLAANATIEEPNIQPSQTLDRVRRYLKSKYQAAWEVFSGDDDDVLDQPEIKRLFERALENLDWREWQVVDSASAMMSVTPRTRKVYIGRQIPPITRLRVKALFAHEVLTHAQRSRNGAKINQKLTHGLHGYRESEEGLGVVLEAAVEGRMPTRVIDRYVDIELAIGTEDRPGITRQEMFEMYITRMLLRLGEAADRADRSMVRKIAWQHVNRIYRGSLGNQFVGVFTRDIAYYQGFLAMVGYLQEHNSSFETALDFALCGKFDPTNPSHVSYVKSRLEV